MDIAAIVLEALLGLAFLMAGAGKMAGSKMHVDNFKHWGLPQWFRIVTALVEWVGAIAMLIGIWEPSWAAAAGLWLAFTMLVGILVHVRVKDSFKQTFPAVILFILPLVVFFIQQSELSAFPGF
ncbi:DoxX family protein [Cohnella sp. NL03-T5]|nr:DoxX family protein [Cohnella silvisoli]